MKKYPQTTCIACWFQSRVLIAKRKDTATFDGYWNFPGGKVEKLELPTKGALRELKEETGVQLFTGDIELIDGITGDSTTDVCFLFETDFTATEAREVHNAELKKSHDWEWCSPEDAMRKKLMPGMKKYLKEAKKRGTY